MKSCTLAAHKQAVEERILPPQNEAVPNVSNDTDITEVTLYEWRKEASAAGSAPSGNGQTSDNGAAKINFSRYGNIYNE